MTSGFCDAESFSDMVTDDCVWLEFISVEISSITNRVANRNMTQSKKIADSATTKPTQSGILHRVTPQLSNGETITQSNTEKMNGTMKLTVKYIKNDIKMNVNTMIPLVRSQKRSLKSGVV
ncbi:MAG: hypothetical protein Q4C70_15605 [Planctomycetia bacterium]|nr:hypothetical protein [Planctomycetia bacterium]